ncbi:coiled-coil domain-containing protein 55 [Blastomyces dermatitidis ATCC 18188]|uniref:Coiled-coil domain-containing protein 55 n=1 Tax=Ajellomyces dermatitidis (strain ATCC 18188 / CBS 674.68) TaxID=653446 RepID=F2TFC8_AJEDA|nr:coiled-coil domain-containing protein 55 [Blastomyces dermatitidis ATCC 18188]
MSRPTLSYGLNLPNKKRQGLPLPNTNNPQKRKRTIFDSDSEDDSAQKEGDGSVEISTIGGLDDDDHNNSTTTRNTDDEGRHSSKKPATSKLKNPPPQTNHYTNLSSLHSSRKHAQTAEALDSSIYDYDAVYDSLHAKPPSTSSSAAANEASTPKYMTALLRSAEIRKRDQLRARDKQLQREREAEGEEYADKEKFVTAAYKAQQEEARRIEAEEAEREREEEERRKKGGGMVGFYKSMLERGAKRHEEVVRAAEEAVRSRPAEDGVDKAKLQEEKEEMEAGEKSEAQIAAELNARGANIILNDEGQVVDKRQLLTAGLNVAQKPSKAKAAPAAGAEKAAGSAGWGGEARWKGVDVAGSGRAGQRARQTEMLAAQLEERMRKEEEEKEAKAKELAAKIKSSKTASDVQSARERYLARKREKEQLAEKEKKGS